MVNRTIYVVDRRFIEKLNFDRNNEKLFCNTKIVVGGNVFHCHRFLLDAVSSYFNRMFRNDFKDSESHSIEVRGAIGFSITARILDQVLQFVYTGTMDCTAEILHDVIHAANFLGIQYLVQFCISNTEDVITGRTWWQMYRAAKDLHLPALKLVCIESVRYCWSDLDLGQATFTDIYDVISCDPKRLGGKNAIRVILLWVSCDQQKRISKLDDLIKLVDFGSVRRQFIEKEIMNSEFVHLAPITTAYIYKKLAERQMIIVSEWGSTIAGAVYKYCPVEKELIRCSKPPYQVERAAVMLDENNLIVVGRENFRSPLHVQIYNVTEDRWHLERSLIGEPRFPTAIAFVNDFLFLIGGLNFNGAFIKSIEGYRVTLQTCSRQPIHFPDMNVERTRHTVVTRNDKVYIIGGFNLRYLKSCEIFDPSSRTIRFTGMLNYGRHGHAAAMTSDGDSIIVTGGYHPSSTALGSSESYSFTTEMWTVLKPLIHPRWGHCSCAYDGKVYIIGGYGAYASSVEVYDPEDARWSLHHYIEYRILSASAVPYRSSQRVSFDLTPNIYDA